MYQEGLYAMQSLLQQLQATYANAFHSTRRGLDGEADWIYGI